MSFIIKSKMATRLFWSEDECVLLLNLIEEKNIIKLLGGRKYRRKDIFKIINEEFKKRGIDNKNEVQLDNKWKNLKKSYIAAKKQNNNSGNSKHTCDYYEQLDRILGSRPSVTAVSQGIDAAQIQSGSSMTTMNIREVNDDDESDGQSDVEPMPKKRKRSSKMQLEIEKINDEFLKKQKSAMDYELKIFAEQEAKQNREFLSGMREILLESNQMFLGEIHTILNVDYSSTTSTTTSTTSETSTTTSNTSSTTSRTSTTSSNCNDILHNQPSTSTTPYNINPITPDIDLEEDLREFIKF